jgi:galactokinase
MIAGKEIKVRAPGRICLFGEHQDYLGFPVIAAAINRFIFIHGSSINNSSSERNFHINQPDLPGAPVINITLPSIDDFLHYQDKRDYLKSGINVARKNGIHWDYSWNITINGTIPINAGASSSSALVIAWLKWLWVAGGRDITPYDLGKLGYQTEVTEFGEAGGMMDHFTSSVGGLLYVESLPFFKVTPLLAKLNGFVLANSGVKKNTVDDLRRVKDTALHGFSHIIEALPSFDRFNTSIEQVQPFLTSLSEAENKNVYGNLVDRDLTHQAFKILSNPDFHKKKNIGTLMNRHHEMLSQYKGVSHPTVDEIVKIALQAGAQGAKVNGSGFGGSVVIYAPKKQDHIVQILQAAGFDCWPILISDGACLE